MDNNSLLSAFLVLAIITVSVIDIIIIYVFVTTFCFKTHDNPINSLRKPLIVSSINDNDRIDNYYTSL
jgi:hypothetical protein